MKPYTLESNKIALMELISLLNDPSCGLVEQLFFSIRDKYTEKEVMRFGHPQLEMKMEFHTTLSDKPIIIWDAYELRSESKDEIRKRFYRRCIVSLLNLYKEDFKNII